MDNIWNEIHETRAWGSYPSEHVIRFFARNYYSKERDKVKILDFGCGGGAHTWYLAREGFDVYAFDGAEAAVKNTRKKLENENLKAHYYVGDGLDVALEDDFFDSVLDNVCIYANRIEEIKKMYKRVYDFLKVGGKLLTVCFGKETLGYGLGNEIEKDTFTDITDGALKDRGITHFFDEESIKQILTESGFKNIVIDRILYTDRGMKVEQYVAQADK